MKRWLCAIGLALSLGCATAVVRPYVGDQQAWPTASGGIVNTKFSLPVFTSLPPSPYEVLAEMRISSPFYAQPEEGHLPRLIKRAQEIGADALLFVQGKIFFSTSYGPRTAEADNAGQKTPTLTTVNTFNPESFVPEVTILAIRWIGNPPPGLPSSGKKIAVSTPPSPVVSEPAPTPAAAPAPAPPADSGKTEEQKPAEAPAVEQPKTEQPAAEIPPHITPSDLPPANPPADK